MQIFYFLKRDLEKDSRLIQKKLLRSRRKFKKEQGKPEKPNLKGICTEKGNESSLT